MFYLPFLNQAALCKEMPSPWQTTYYLNDETREVRVSVLKETMVIGFLETKGEPTWPLGRDWRSNFQLRETSFEIGEGYALEGPEGFVKEFLSLRNDLLDVIKQHQPKILYLCGRSQGGAHALYLYATLLLALPELLVFGVGIAMPRALSFSSLKLLKKLEKTRLSFQFLRVNATGDLVPNLPLWLLGYEHHGSETLLGNWWWSLFPFMPFRHLNSVYEPLMKKSHFLV